MHLNIERTYSRIVRETSTNGTVCAGCVDVECGLTGQAAQATRGDTQDVTDKTVTRANMKEFVDIDTVQV